MNAGVRTVLLASLRRHTRRYVAAAVAVVIGVAFVVVTDALSRATRDGLTADVAAPYGDAGLVVTPDTQEEADALVAAAREDGTAVAAEGYATEPVFAAGVRLSPSVRVREAATDPAMQYLELLDGRQPTRAGEALADAGDAEEQRVGVGDVLVVGSAGAATEVTVVGLVDGPASVDASLYLPWDDLRRLEESLWVQAVAWGGSDERALEVAPDATVTPTDEHVAAVQAEIARGVDYLSYMALLFVAIALFVAVMVIANTFSILFAQRMREFALLRCVGVTRRQLRRSVRLEALVLGLVASLAGVALGLVGGVAVVALVGVWFDDIGAVSFGPTWLVGSVLVGTAVTTGAAWLPTRAVTRVAPLAALRPDTGVDVRDAAGRLRVASAVLLLLGGTALLAACLASSSLGLMLAGGVAVFLGVLLLGPLLVPAAIRLAGRLAGDGPVRRLATGNAVRNPRRTATTAASLLVGVTLTTAVLTGLATSRTTLADEMDLSYPVDAAVSALDAPLPDGTAEQVAAVEGVTEVVELRGTMATVAGVEVPVAEVDGRQPVVRGDRDLAPAQGQLLLPWQVGNEVAGKAQRQLARDQTATVVVGDRSLELEVVHESGWGAVVLVPPGTLDALEAASATVAVWARADDGTDAGDLADALESRAAAAGGELEEGFSNRSWVDLQVDILTGAVVGLLGVAVLIALLGIANTLGLSVLERGRENALLRAMGLTRQQLQRSMAVEGLLLSLVATVLGTLLGVAFAWVGARVMISGVVDELSMTLPVGQLLLVVAVAALAGLGACVVPARRAARVAPAAGLALD
ncbi:FtsX-like permease family protein [Nocardioides solisilvae]|uniref:FtsX-like permease family protein n=1 Tax=Nocardioides solisilvae TaxID=1542435 RepID=UPI000D7503D6|nr:FtsX-like permease family protein [Nocardioides solisilvae]